MALAVAEHGLLSDTDTVSEASCPQRLQRITGRQLKGLAKSWLHVRGRCTRQHPATV